jgi:histidinol dehydrogenase
MIKIVDAHDTAAVKALLWPERDRDGETEQRVAQIVADVRTNGEAALLRYAREFDRLEGPIEISRREMHAAAKTVPARVRHAIRVAAKNIRAVAKRQVTARMEAARRRGPHRRATHRAARPRRLLRARRSLSPALDGTDDGDSRDIAGVKDVIAVCPKPDAVVMAAALEAGVSRFFRIGGAQAIAALAYGTESVPRVNKIVGPGNRYVAAAKAQIAADCGIDFYAGPTEIVIVATKGPAEWIAADLIAQAEHDPDARAVLITTSRALANQVGAAVDAAMPPTGPAADSIRAHGGIIVTRSKSEAIALANEAAAEHLVVDDDAWRRSALCRLTLRGPWSAQVAGDYAIGSNHVLPTAGAARVRGGCQRPTSSARSRFSG